MRSLAESFIRHGANLHIDSINGYELVPLQWHKMKSEAKDADIDLSYTLPRNFKDRFSPDSKLKIAIYNYESTVLPSAWSNSHKYVDYILPSSNFSKKVFVDAGWPDEKCIVVPHGIWPEEYIRKDKVNNLKTRKKFKFLNVSIPHYRKNIAILLDAYYGEFSASEDVCLVLKTSLKKPKYKFECNVRKEVVKAQRRHPRKRLPQVELVTHRYDSLVPLYNTCDCLISATSSEGFGLPLLEGMAAGMLVVAPHVTGQADFLNKNNSLEVASKRVYAPAEYQYWRPSKGAQIYMPEKDSLKHSMRNAFENKDNLLPDFEEEIGKTLREYTWMNAAKKILSIK
tara:strand:+ start:9447 stop:10469 length:1023 start_codon:yes stop_codon:yes gene_type:complete